MWNLRKRCEQKHLWVMHKAQWRFDRNLSRLKAQRGAIAWSPSRPINPPCIRLLDYRYGSGTRNPVTLSHRVTRCVLVCTRRANVTTKYRRQRKCVVRLVSDYIALQWRLVLSSGTGRSGRLRSLCRVITMTTRR